MNLREAILAGARRTNAQWARMMFLQRPLSPDEPWRMCALTAAYFGCHPDIEPGDVSRPGEDVSRWAVDNVPDMGWVMSINDASNHRDEIRAGGWETLCDLLHRYQQPKDGTPLDKVEVCDESA